MKTTSQLSKVGSTKPVEKSNKILFAVGHADDMVALYATGYYAEYLVYDCSGEVDDWTEMVPWPEQPTNLCQTPGLWVWEFNPTGGGFDYWGEANDVDIDKGEWRALEEREWYFVRQGECPWPSYQEPENLKSSFTTCKMIRIP
jgi:hypothetical protein